ncbi:hypothetical protein NIES2100_65550 [Calothrix sp. NIES-2100]|nr:hypothetical protein NIES2100_65550 [Calothrix sp. NIES-2100]
MLKIEVNGGIVGRRSHVHSPSPECQFFPDIASAQLTLSVWLTNSPQLRSQL